MARLPKPGQDNGIWGDLLNEFLGIEHNSDGTLRANASLASKYTKPAGGIPSSDLTPAIQSSLSKANAAPTSLGQLSDVDVSSVSDAQVLSYNNSSGKWLPGNSSGVSDATPSAKGKVQLAGDLGGTAASPSVKSRAVTYTIAPTSGDFPVSSYASADLAVQAAINAVAAATGTIKILPGIYSFANAVTINNSYITVSGSGVESTIIHASNSFSNGLITINTITGSPSVVRQINIEDITFDVNSQANVMGISVKGGLYADNSSSKYINIRRCEFKNLATVDVGLFQVFSGRGTNDRGPVTDIKIQDCDFLDTVKWHAYFNGGEIKNVKFLNCTFKNSQVGCIAYSQQNKSNSSVAAGVRSNQNWEIAGCYFGNNYLGPDLGTTIGYIHDANRTGIRGLNIHDNYVDKYVTTAEQYWLNLHSCWDLRITHNTLWRTRSAFNIGQSNNGPWYQEDGTQLTHVKDNTFYQCYNICDHDSDFFSEWSGNRFIEIAYSGLNGYSRQWPSMYHHNFFYNTPTLTTGDISTKSAFIVTPNGLSIHDNIIIDDRKLPNPTTAPVLSTISGGSLSARTYYVTYTWANDTGETLCSPESTISVAANSLLKIAHPYTSSYGPPSGAKKVNFYIATTSGSETLQGFTPTSWQQDTETVKTNSFGVITWIEPATNLQSGSALPSQNTTSTITQQGIYEATSSSGPLYPNIYQNNSFYGLQDAFSFQASYKHITRDNVIVPDLTTALAYSVEKSPYDLGSVTTSITIDPANGEFQKMTLTGNAVITLASGLYIGQQLVIEFIQDGVGNRVPNLSGNFKSAGGGLTFTTGANAIDMIVASWDGTNYIEISRAQNAAAATLPQALGTSDSPTFSSEILNGDLTLGGAANRNIAMGRTSSGTGSDLIVQAGGAVSGAINSNAGNLYLYSGIATGSGAGSVFLGASGAGSSGTVDKTPSVKANISGSQNGRLAIGTGTTTGTVDGITMGGSNARSIVLTRNSNSNTAGVALTLQSGGAISGATNKSAGDMVISTGLSTGSGIGQILLQTSANTAASTTDNVLSTRVTIDSNQISLQNSIKVKRSAVADIAYTILINDYIVAYTSLTSARIVTLPSAIIVGSGTVYIIKDETGTCGANNVNIVTTSGQTIDGTNSKAINTNYGVMKVYSNGANWFTI